MDARFEPIDYGLQNVETYDVTFNGYGGQSIKGWFLVPRQRLEKLPCLVEFIGYGRGRGYPTEWLLWSTVGYIASVLVAEGVI